MKEIPKLLVANKKGKVFDVPHLEAVGMKAGHYFRIKPSDLVPLHPDSELFLLPQRSPIGFDPKRGKYIEARGSSFMDPKEEYFTVAAFPAPGYTATHNAAYIEKKKTSRLPLFCYTAASFYKGRIFITALRIDREKRQELSGMNSKLLTKNTKAFKKIFPGNRLLKHLERCALTYCCPAAKNFFLKRYEGPLPTSPTCNARCIGCISFQPGKGCSVTQPRIKFIPTPREIAEIALFHIKEVKSPVVSFGQGCEGEPLMVGEVIEEAVRLIRRSTQKGIININTNASKPDMIKRLFDEGINSIRVSLNSVQKEYYNAYYKPKGYTLNDVIKSIMYAKKSRGFVSINYLTMPGFTDSVSEVSGFFRFLDKTDIDMIQWRNLNYDPLLYFKTLNLKVKPKEMIGIRSLIEKVKKEHPKLMHGYFNPSKVRIKSSKKSKKGKV